MSAPSPTGYRSAAAALHATPGTASPGFVGPSPTPTVTATPFDAPTIEAVTPDPSPTTSATAAAPSAAPTAAPAAPAQHAPPSGLRYIAGGGTVGSAASQAFASLQLRIGSGGSMSMIHPPNAKNPDVNPQHTQVVFEAYPGFTWIMNVDGTGARPLSPTSGGGWMEPRFARNGATVVTSHDIGGGHQEIFEIDVATGGISQLTNAPQYPWKWRPSIDPTGSRLIVTYGTDSNGTSGPGSHIGVAALGQGLIADFTPLTPIDPSRPSYDGEFSPAGDSIIFDAGSQIWVAAADGSGAHPVAAGKLGRFNPLTRGQIVFTHEVGAPGTNTQLWAAMADGSQAHVVADGNFAESFCVLP
jgi:hypothetical protein